MEKKNSHIRCRPSESAKKKTAPARIDEFPGGRAAPEFYDDAVCHYRKIYYHFLDCIINAIEDRFDQEDFKVYTKRKLLQ